LVVEEAELVLKQHRIALALGSVVEEADWRTCQHLRLEEVL
jgi:hypothetical protein